ncbi:MAG: hypothetical protein V6Z86_06475 [Hyphomicrobiales bacterium]
MVDVFSSFERFDARQIAAVSASLRMWATGSKLLCCEGLENAEHFPHLRASYPKPVAARHFDRMNEPTP